MFLVNYSVALPYSASILYPFIAGYHANDLVFFLLTAIISVLMLIKFHGNLMKAVRGEDVKVRDFIRIQFSK